MVERSASSALRIDCFFGSYAAFREQLLSDYTWNMLIILGPAAFRDMNWWAANTQMSVVSRMLPDSGNTMTGIDVSAPRIPAENAMLLQTTSLIKVKRL